MRTSIEASCINGCDCSWNKDAGQSSATSETTGAQCANIWRQRNGRQSCASLEHIDAQCRDLTWKGQAC